MWSIFPKVTQLEYPSTERARAAGTPWLLLPRKQGGKLRMWPQVISRRPQNIYFETSDSFQCNLVLNKGPGPDNMSVELDRFQNPIGAGNQH